jgi:hypothetical protein
MPYDVLPVAEIRTEKDFGTSQTFVNRAKRPYRITGGKF